MRGIVASVLVLLLAATAVMPHRHGLLSGLSDFSGGDPRISAPGSVAGSNDRVCDACVRQHGYGLAPAVRHLVVPRAQSAFHAPAIVPVQTSQRRSNVSLRGPPSSLPVC